MHRVKPNNRAVENSCGYSLHLKIILIQGAIRALCTFLHARNIKIGFFPKINFYKVML